MYISRHIWKKLIFSIIVFECLLNIVSTQKFFRKQKKNFKKPSGLTDEDVKGALIRNKKPDFGGEPVSGSPFLAVAFSPFNSDGDTRLGSVPDSGCGVGRQSSPHLSFNQPRKDFANKSRNALSLESTAKELMDKIGEDVDLRYYNSKTSNEIADDCEWLTDKPVCNTINPKKYRSLDGSCNNLKETNYGRAFTPFSRILETEYAPGTINGPRLAKDGTELPSARLLSTTVAKLNNDQTGKDEINPTSYRTVWLMQMGQFIDHDFAHSPNFPNGTFGNDCCCPEAQFYSDFEERCFPIPIPEDDSFFKTINRTCMDFHRAEPTPALDCALGKREQMNQITHWLDASNIYGSADHEALILRSQNGGKLKVTKDGNMLPRCTNFADLNDGLESCHNTDMTCGNDCFAGGDSRANEHHTLTVIHTLWMREHNRLAELLKNQHPSWNDEKLYEEARRIVIAEYQHVIYKEWLPHILGVASMKDSGLYPLQDGYVVNYQDEDDFDPRITNEFAVAAFRFGHSLIPSSFKKITRDRQSRAQDLKSLFFNPRSFTEEEGRITGLVKGMTVQKGEAWDDTFADDIINHLFEMKGNEKATAMDLVALNIQRGRDHGVPGYNSYREACGLKRATNFDDLIDDIPQDDIERLKKTYKHVDDVDLFAGGFLEERDTAAILGPVFRCIVNDQFYKLKFGDRFWYEMGGDEDIRFTTEELKEIRKVSLARIICDNTKDVTKMQPHAFMTQDSNGNEEVSCDDTSKIPKLDITPFRGVGAGSAKKRPIIFPDSPIVKPTTIKPKVTTVEPTVPTSRCFTTVESANPNRPCIFPFEWKGIVYNTCTLTETPKANKAWCSTKVDESGKHVNGERMFGICGNGCPFPENEGSCGNFAKVTNIETCNRCGQINSCSLCMKILSNSALDLTVGCLDKGFDIGNLVEWEVNGVIIEKDSNTDDESCLTLNWSQDLKLGQQNRVVCRVKQHPSTPTWQEITGFVYDETDLQFRTN